MRKPKKSEQEKEKRTFRRWAKAKRNVWCKSRTHDSSTPGHKHGRSSTFVVGASLKRDTTSLTRRLNCERTILARSISMASCGQGSCEQSKKQTKCLVQNLNMRSPHPSGVLTIDWTVQYWLQSQGHQPACRKHGRIPRQTILWSPQETQMWPPSRATTTVRFFLFIVILFSANACLEAICPLWLDIETSSLNIVHVAL